MFCTQHTCVYTILLISASEQNMIIGCGQWQTFLLPVFNLEKKLLQSIKVDIPKKISKVNYS